jgi:hypothetical protein
MTISEFGKRLWGRGEQDAQRRIDSISREELTAMGLSAELAREWRDYYQREVIRQRGLPTSHVRLKLLEKSLELLSSKE